MQQNGQQNPSQPLPQIVSNSETSSRYRNAHHKNNKIKYVVYFASVLSAASLVGLIGAYAVLKNQIANDLGFKQGFLGILDSLSFFGRIVGYLWMIVYPSRKPKKDYFINSILTSVFLLLVPLCSVFREYSSSMLVTSMVLSGFSRSYVIIPNFIMLHYFGSKDSKDTSNRKFINFWGALTTMGDVIAILFTSFLLQIQISWQICFFINIAIFMVCSTVLYVVAQEIPMAGAVSLQDVSYKQKICQFYQRDDNLWWMLQYCLLSTIYYNILMWFPYYFQQLGYSFHSSTISTMYPTFALVSVYIFQNYFRKSSHCQKHLILIMYLINIFLYVVMFSIGTSQSSIKWYVVVVGLSGLVQGGPYSEVTSLELRVKARNDLEVFFALATSKILYHVGVIVGMIAIGRLMQFYFRALLWVILANALLTFLVHFWRLFKYGSTLYSNVQSTNQMQQRQRNEGGLAIQAFQIGSNASYNQHRREQLQSQLEEQQREQLEVQLQMHQNLVERNRNV